MTDATATEELETNDEEEVDDVATEDANDQPSSLSEAVAEVPQPGLGFPPKIAVGRMPSATEAADLMVSDLMRVAARLGPAEEELQSPDWGFEFVADDFRSAQRAALADFNEALRMLDDLRVGLLRWFRAVGFTPVVQLDEPAWNAARELAVLPLSFQPVSLAVNAAVLHLAQQPDAEAIMARFEQRRLEGLRDESGRPARAGYPDCWPWTQEDGTPWPAGPSAASSETAADLRPDGEAAPHDRRKQKPLRRGR